MAKRLVAIAATFLMCTAALALGEELSFLKAKPELKAELVQWEQEAPPEVQAEIQVLRTGKPRAQIEATVRLGKMGERAKGAILPLLETSRVMIGVGGPGLPPSPAEGAAQALGKCQVHLTPSLPH